MKISCFRFTEISCFLNFSSNENVRKQRLSANAFSWVSKKFSYMIAVRKDEMSYCKKYKPFFVRV